MRTAEAVFKKLFTKEAVRIDKEMLTDEQWDSFNKEAGYVIYKAMKQYAKEAIELCAENAKVLDKAHNRKQNIYVVNKQSILNLINELK